MADTDDELPSLGTPSRPQSAEERRQAELRQAADENQAAQQRHAAEVERSAALIKEQSGSQLEKVIAIAGDNDDAIKAAAVDHLAFRIAERGVTPDQMSFKDLARLGDQSIEQAYKARDAEEQQAVAPPVAERQHDDPIQGVQLRDGRRDYGELQDAHEEVATRQAAAAQQQAAPDPLQPVEIQDHSPAETHTGKVDRVAEFLKAENLDRESRKAILQEFGRAAGREITEQEGKEMSRDAGGGQSL